MCKFVKTTWNTIFYCKLRTICVHLTLVFYSSKQLNKTLKVAKPETKINLEYHLSQSLNILSKNNVNSPNHG